MKTRTPASTPTDRRCGHTSPRTRVPRKWTAASILATLLIAIIGFAAVQPTQPAEAQSTTSLVKNTGSGNNDNNYGLTQYQIPRRAQAFTTGPCERRVHSRQHRHQVLGNRQHVHRSSPVASNPQRARLKRQPGQQSLHPQ